MQGTGQQAAKLGFKLCHARGKRRIARARARLKRRTRCGWLETADRFWFARVRRSENSSETKGRTMRVRNAALLRVRTMAAADVAEQAVASNRSAGRAPLLRPRPPRRPRRLRRWPGRSPPWPAAVPQLQRAVRKLLPAGRHPARQHVSETCPSEYSVMIGSNRAAGSAFASLTEAAAGATGIGAPKRVSASSAFCFHCARRKRSAAAVYQRTASECAPVFSWICASSNATMASRVRSYNAASCPGGSALVRALRMRA